MRNKNRYISTTITPMAKNLGSMVTNFEELLPIYSNLWSNGLARSCDKLIHYISTIMVPMVTKLDRMATSVE